MAKRGQGGRGLLLPKGGRAQPRTWKRRRRREGGSGSGGGGIEEPSEGQEQARPAKELDWEKRGPSLRTPAQPQSPPGGKGQDSSPLRTAESSQAPPRGEGLAWSPHQLAPPTLRALGQASDTAARVTHWQKDGQAARPICVGALLPAHSPTAEEGHPTLSRAPRQRGLGHPQHCQQMPRGEGPPRPSHPSPPPTAPRAPLPSKAPKRQVLAMPHPPKKPAGQPVPGKRQWIQASLFRWPAWCGG